MAVVLVIAKSRREYVQVQAIFVVARRCEPSEGIGLHASIPERQRIKHFVPGVDRLRRHPAQGPDGGRRVWNTKENVDPLALVPSYWTIADLNDVGANNFGVGRRASRV